MPREEEARRRLERMRAPDAERNRDRKRKLIVFAALTLVGCVTAFGAMVIAFCDGSSGRSGLGTGCVSDVTNWVFLLPDILVGLLAEVTHTRQLVFGCCGLPLLLLNPLIYAAFWYGCWRAFAWLFRRRAEEER